MRAGPHRCGLLRGNAVLLGVGTGKGKDIALVVNRTGRLVRLADAGKTVKRLFNLAVAVNFVEVDMVLAGDLLQLHLRQGHQADIGAGGRGRSSGCRQSRQPGWPGQPPRIY